MTAVPDNLKVVPDKEDVTSEVLVFALGLATRLERTAINVDGRQEARVLEQAEAVA